MSDIGRWRRTYCNEFYAAPYQSINSDQRVVYHYSKCSEQMTPFGLARISAARAQEDLGNLTSFEFEQHLDAVINAFDWRYDATTRVLWIPTWLDENPPASPNVVKSWLKMLANVPDCDVKTEAIAGLIKHLESIGPSFVEALGDLPKTFRKSKVQPKVETKPNQRAENRDQRSGKQRTGALRAVALNDVNPEWLSIARQTIGKYGNQGFDIDTLIDYFHHEGRPRTEGAKRTEVIAALNLAIAERRAS